MHAINIDADLLIVGGGSGGIVAAISAAEAGVKRITVLEKSKRIGGQAGAAQGMYAVNSVLQQAEGVEIDIRKEFEDILHSTSYCSNAILLKMYLENCGRVVNWLLDHGINMRLTEHTQQFGHVKTGRVFHRWNHLPGRCESLKERALNLGVDIILQTTVQALTSDETGQITGARGISDGGEMIFITAKAVILATGGFVGNGEMLKNALYNQIGREPIHFSSPSVGDGMRMAWDAGAGKSSENSMVMHGVMPGKGFPHHHTHTDQALMNIPILWVNCQGQRFCNEETIYDSQLFGNSVLAQGGEVYAVFDQKTLDTFKSGTIPYEMQFWDRLGENGTFYPAAVKDFDREFQQLMADGTGYISDSPEGLAVKVGWDDSIFLKTLNRYNEAVRTGVDTEFYKSAKYLRYPVEEGPFYALRGRTIVMVTVGGVKIDSNFRALTPNNKVIPSLYVIGSDAGGLYHGTSYLPKEGVALGWALVSGMMAGENIGGLLAENFELL